MTGGRTDMKIYCLLSTESGPLKSSATVDLFLHHEEAQSAMRAAYERKLTALPFDVSLQADWHRCSCEKDLASIIDGAHTYTWCVQERELDVEVAVEVQGGMVQNIYANADVRAEVYDLDLTDIQEEGGTSEGELRQAALAEEISKPGWRSIW